MPGKAEKMYKDPPSLEQGDDGKVRVKKKEASDKDVDASAKAADVDGMPLHARQAMERRDMYGRQEDEHAMHDNGAGGSKAEMFARHQAELKDMAKRHEKEHGKK